MIHPRSLSIQEPYPARTTWVCERHGELEPGTSECAACEPESGDRPHR
jgi:hypothetical protein